MAGPNVHGHAAGVAENATVLETGVPATGRPGVAGKTGPEPGRADGRPAQRGMGRGKAEGRIRSGSRILAGLAFGLLLAGYAVAFGYSAAQPTAVAGDQVLADWLAGHGLRYGLGGASANIVTVDSGGRAGVAAVAARGGRVRPLLYQSSAAAYDPRRRDATFLITGAPAARAGDAAEAIPAAAVRATFGRPARSYRFDGFTVEVWNVNLLTKMRG
jgi:hypothetical protein